MQAVSQNDTIYLFELVYHFEIYNIICRIVGYCNIAKVRVATAVLVLVALRRFFICIPTLISSDMENLSV